MRSQFQTDDQRLCADSFQAYRWDHHLTNDTLSELLPGEMRVILRQVWQQTPSALAWALATEYPCTETRMDEIEGRIQGRLDLH